MPEIVRGFVLSWLGELVKRLDEAVGRRWINLLLRLMYVSILIVVIGVMFTIAFVVAEWVYFFLTKAGILGWVEDPTVFRVILIIALVISALLIVTSIINFIDGVVTRRLAKKLLAQDRVMEERMKVCRELLEYLKTHDEQKEASDNPENE